MAKVILSRIDSPERNDVSLSVGEVSIGRGSILGCDDKRISRNHGLLHVSDDGCITLFSLHSNPCFYKEQNLDTYAVLVKGQSKILSPGDEFALLPHSFRYRINVVKMDHDLGPGSSVVTTSTVDTMPDSVSTTPSKRKRILPGWLTDLSRNQPSSSTTADPSLPCPTSSTSRKRKAPSETEHVKTAIKEEPSTVDGASGDVKPDVGRNKDGYEEEYGMANPTDAVGAGPSEEEAANPTDAVGAGPSEEEAANPTDAVGAGPSEEEAANPTNRDAPGSSSRDTCVYGATCYRKNPQHRVEFSHPGDPDFSVDPLLPECPYGTSCYRKNLQHRKDYKHDNPPVAAPTTRIRPRATTKDGEDSEDDYDYNDPFLNDASSDDYQPTSSEDSDGEEEEDEDEESQERKRMLREAKKFTKKKKKK